LTHTARLIDGTGIARALRAGLAVRVAALAAAGRAPGLAVILVGDDPASQIYVRNKVKACAEVGIRSLQETHPATLDEAGLLGRIDMLNADPSVHGILVQMPLPRHISAARVIEAIDVRKDVDGYSIESAGRLVAGVPGFRPCTPWGCMRLIESTGIALRGRHAVVIGRSNTVGKPMALLLLQADATRRHRGRRGRSRRNAHRADGQARRGRDRRRHEPRRRRQAVRRRRLCRRRADRRRDHAGAGRRRPDDDRHAAVEHGRCRRARGGRDFLTVSGRGKL
jgi:5,10-methylene-tetrahydrofolate dehydrogenase/methenyl tetrahydrofolate cyclohydrolase